MGFFSFKTQDTRRSISNCHSKRPTFDVYMVDNKGNEYHEPNYGGYGVFCNKDFFVLMAEMNGIQEDTEQRMRSRAIELYFDHEEGTLYPNLFAKPNRPWRNKRPDDCQYQGFFY